MAGRLSGPVARSTLTALTNDDCEWRRLWAHGLCAGTTLGRILSVDASRYGAAARKPCAAQRSLPVLRQGFVCDCVASVAVMAAAGWRQCGDKLDCSFIQAVRVHVPPRQLLHGLMAHVHATRTPVNTTCLCDVARARKYGMFCTRASLITNTTFTTLIHSQFQAASLYFFRELGRVRAAAERLRVLYAPRACRYSRASE